MFSTDTPSVQRRRKPLTYGKQSRPAFQSLEDDFVEGQDFVFTQKHALKSSKFPKPSGLSDNVQRKPIHQSAVPRRQSLDDPFTHATVPIGTPKLASVKPSLASGISAAATTLLEPSIFDPPSSDEDPEHYQILPTRLKKSVIPARPLGGGLASAKPPESRRIQVSKNQSKSNDVKRTIGTNAPVPPKRDFEVSSSGEEKAATELKRKRLPLARPANPSSSSAPAVPLHKASPAMMRHEDLPKHPKRARMSPTSLRSGPSPLQASPPMRNSQQGSNASTPRASLRRTKTAPTGLQARIVQNETSPTAALSSMVRPQVESPQCDSMTGFVEYVPPIRRRRSSASDPWGLPEAPATPSTGSRAVTTPRQEKLWNAFLQVDSPSPSEAQLPSGYFPNEADTITQPSQSNNGPTRRRLVDALKMVVEPSSDITPSDDVDEESAADDEADIRSLSQQSLQPQSQSQAIDVVTSQSRITYASQRSFLAAPGDSLEELLQPLDDLGPFGSPPMPGLPQTKSNLASADVSDDEDGATKAMRSVHELRAAGGSRRFEDEVPLGDLEGSGKAATSRRRTALMDICRKLMKDADFLSRFSQSGSECLVINRCKSDKDGITLALVAAVVALVLNFQKSSEVATQVYNTGIMDCLLMSTNEPRTLHAVSKDRTSNMSKFAQTTTAELQSELALLKWWGHEDLIIGPKLLALKAMELLVRRNRESGNVEGLLTKEMLLKYLEILEERSTNNRGDNSRLNQLKVEEELVLSILESSAIGEACTSDASLWDASCLSRLVNSLRSIIARSEISGLLQGLILRTCVSLANNNERISSAFADPMMLGAILNIVNGTFLKIEQLPSSEGILLLDNLVLALAAMMNLAEWSDVVRLTLLEHNVDALDKMISIFVTFSAKAEEADSIEATEINVAYGYLAVLLGTICQSTPLREHVRAKLPSQKLDSLIGAIDEFVLLQRAVDSQRKDERGVAFTERLAAVATTLKSVA